VAGYLKLEARLSFSGGRGEQKRVAGWTSSVDAHGCSRTAARAGSPASSSMDGLPIEADPSGGEADSSISSRDTDGERRGPEPLLPVPAVDRCSPDAGNNAGKTDDCHDNSTYTP
jgi:hypothetical protein